MSGATPFRATYRLQFRGGMDFAAAVAVVPYLARLGVSHLYASPLFAAREGSSHGYDIVDCNRLDPQLGGEAGFLALTEALSQAGLGLILDIVPNHMATDWQNLWWRDVLALGRASRFVDRFDIDWSQHDGRVLLPVLGDSYGETLKAGSLQLVPREGQTAIAYHDHLFPLAPGSLQAAGAVEGEGPLPAERMHALLEAQHYRLAHWRIAAGGLNYRRFFDVNDLVGLRVEDPAVFDAVHDLTLRLVREGLVHGLRVDHVDGLADPAGYLRRLRDAVQAVCPGGGDDAASCPIWVEKILEPGERLRDDWPVAGTTGYEFAAQVTGLAVAPAGLAELREGYARFTGDARSFPAQAAAAKRELLDLTFAGELAALAAQAEGLAAAGLDSRDLPVESLRRALRELLVAMPVYRSYVAGTAGASAADRSLIAGAVSGAAPAVGAEGAAALAFLAGLLQGRQPEHAAFARRFQQLSGPLMAKSVEDTGFYRYLPALALNEVGNAPGAPPASPAAFHAANAERLQQWPLAMLATATHDTKRGEDLRARLTLLADCAPAFSALAEHWWFAHQPFRGGAEGQSPAAKEAWLFYQTLVGLWPEDLDLAAPDAAARLDALARRLEAYMQKAMREAKERTRWTGADAVHENAVRDFLQAALSPSRSAAFLAEVQALVRRLAPAARAGSLAQLVLKLTCPGLPDIYQGTEWPDLALVDPDNRRPVDFARRAAQLDGPAGMPAPLHPTAGLAGDARKLAVMHCLLTLRRRQPDLLAAGSYLPLAVTGAAAEDFLAYARTLPGRCLLVCVPLRPLRQVAGEALPPPDAGIALAGTGLERFRWQDLLTGAAHRPADRLQVSCLLQQAEVAILLTRLP